MPPFRTLQAPRTEPYAFADVQAFQNILQALGQAETLRQNRHLRNRVMHALSMGAGPEEIASIVNQPVPYSGGVPGIFQRIGEMFGPQTTQIEEDVTKGILTEKFRRPTMSDIRLTEYHKALAEGDKERADKLLMSSLVNLDFGRAPWWMEGAGEAEKEKYRQKQIEEKEEPLSFTDMARAEKAMGAFIDAAGKKRIGKNYQKKDLLRAWEDFKTETQYDEKPAGQKQQLWSLWRNVLEKRNAATNRFRQKIGIGEGEYEFDPEDPDWIKSSGMGKEGPPAPTSENEKQAYNMIYDVWDFLPKNVQDAIKLRRQMKEPYTEIINYDEISSAISKRTR